MTIDAASAALYGAMIGGAALAVGTIITNVAASRREAKTFLRTKSQQYLERVCDSYEFALIVFFNLNRNAAPDKATYGTMFAQLSLYGSHKVKSILDSYMASTDHPKAIDIEQLVLAMQDHLKELGRGAK